MVILVNISNSYSRCDHDSWMTALGMAVTGGKTRSSSN